MMKPKKLRNIIRKVTSALDWTIRVEEGGDLLHIVSDHAGKSHTIYKPTDDVRDHEFLHELGHATLCESVSPVFSTNHFAPGTLQELIDLATPAFQSASDWFIDAWLMRVAPESESAMIDETSSMVIEGIRRETSGGSDLQKVMVSALMIAEAIKWRGLQISCGADLGAMARDFLSVSPDRPSAAKYSLLLNKLLSYSGLKADYDQEMGQWSLERVGQ